MNGVQFKRGLVTESKPGWARVHLQEDDVVTDWLQVVYQRAMNDGDCWPLEVNEQVACLMDGKCEEGVILGATYSEADVPDGANGAGIYRKTFSDGTYISYDKNKQEFKASIAGKKATINVGTQMIEMDGSKYSIKTASDSLGGIMNDLLQALEDMTYTNSGGTTSPANNLSDLIALKTRIDNFLII